MFNIGTVDPDVARTQPFRSPAGDRDDMAGRRRDGFTGHKQSSHSPCAVAVISTGAKRGGEICGFYSRMSSPGHNHPPLCHLDRRNHGPSPTQGDEKWVLFSNHTQWKRRPPLCHLDRSSEGAQWRDLRSSGPCVEMIPLSTQLWQIQPTQDFNLSPVATLI